MGRPREDTARRCHQQAKERCFRKTQLGQHFDLGLPASRILRNEFLLLKPLVLWFMVTEAPENERALSLPAQPLSTFPFTSTTMPHAHHNSRIESCGTRRTWSLAKGALRNSLLLCGTHFLQNYTGRTQLV